MPTPRLAFVFALTACGRLSFDDGTHDAAQGDGRNGDSGPIADGPGVDCHVSHASAIFCDGFENGMTPWGYSVIDQGTVDTTTLRAWGGTHALEVHTPDSAIYKSARWGSFLPSAITTGELFVRQYMWLPSSVASSQVSLIVTGNGATPFPSTFMFLLGPELVISTDTNSFSTPDVLPRDRWVCFEMQTHIDPTAGFVKITFDGSTAFQTPLTDTDVAGGYTNVDVGVHYATDTQPAVSLWIDDVVVDTNPIGCN
ncbi:MAG TPA: hypothetical protein VMZ53_11265 [Kofleriaceae bacterium]|nr:hypothetical protein [Kofleriaceae bacterium]